MKRRTDLDALRQEPGLSDPARVLRGLNLSTSHRQKNGFFICCPFHKENTPSCSIQKVDGVLLVHCLACHESGDVFKLIGAVRGLADFPRIIEEARSIAGLPATADDDEHDEPDEPKQEARKVTTVVFHAIVRPLLHLGRLDDSPIARDGTAYLRGRGLLDAAVADGWACFPSTASTRREWIKMLRETFDGRDIDGCGFVRGSGLTFPDNRLVVPWRDPSGLVDTIQRRRLDGQASSKYVFPSGRAPQWPYGIERLASAPLDAPIVLVEGAVDVLARRILDMDQGKVRVVLGVPGGGWRKRWAEYGKDRVVYVATDADEAGNRFCEQWSEQLYSAGCVEVKRLRPVGSKDWGDQVAARVVS